MLYTNNTDLQPSSKDKAIRTKVKLVRSNETGKLIGFVTRDVFGKWLGTRQASDAPKVVCVVDTELARTLVPGVLYDVVGVPMKERHGFVIVEAEPSTFEAKLEIVNTPNSEYRIEVKFGSHMITFNPLDTKHPSIGTIEGVVKSIESRVDISNKEWIVDSFRETATTLLRYCYEDGALPLQPAR